MPALSAVLHSEWVKIKSVRSTGWTLVAAFVINVGFGTLICALSNSQFDDLSKADQLSFDAAGTAFTGGVLGQLAMVAFGVLVVGSEYTTTMIRISLAAVPRRGVFYVCKLTVATVVATVVGLVTSVVTFFAGQAALGTHSTTIGEDHVLRAVIGAGLYMALIALLSMGVAAMLRSTMLAMGILMPFFFLMAELGATYDYEVEVVDLFV
ncbi:ABC transporter permease, partial [Streptomyces sp. NPDC005407]|uniref:ABC transporter permease n=1 Tax=Streptomyces sp. NPDC005407 TaxID=3155340 RepID=UPI0033B08002